MYLENNFVTQNDVSFVFISGIVPDEIIDSLRSKKLKPPVKPRDPKDNALMLGEFPVVMNLIKDVPEAQEAKHQVNFTIFTLQKIATINLRIFCRGKQHLNLQAIVIGRPLDNGSYPSDVDD